MDATGLQQMLRSLCFETEWDYAVFWKLRHRAQKVLTCEDAYFHSRQNNAPKNFGHHSHNHLGSTIAKLSYQVYSLGEGAVGQVAASGKHEWVFAENFKNSCPSFECDGWQSQFSAGIQTVVVVAVGTLGVVQLGSLCKVTENAALVAHIRHLFSGLEGSVGHVTKLMQQGAASLPSLPAGRLNDADKAVQKEESNIWLPAFEYAITVSDSLSCTSQLPNIHQEKALQGVKSYGRMGLTVDGAYEALEFEPGSKISNLKLESQVGRDFICDALHKGEASRSKGSCDGLKENVHTDSNNDVLDEGPIWLDELLAEHRHSNLHQAFCDTLKVNDLDSYQSGMPHVPESSDGTYWKDSAQLESEISLSQFYDSNTPLRFSAGCELLEALGPAFVKTDSSCVWKADKTMVVASTDMPEEISSSRLALDSGPENLLEAVVANVCHSVSDVRNELSISRSQQSLLTTDRMVGPNHGNHMTNSVGCSINQTCRSGGDMLQSSLKVCGAFSPRGFSSTSPSSCSEQLEKSMEAPKKNKKRAKPGESCRPRPRDRQLIQDRIKELRELVPNGSKYSIDSLLERTVKHMLFLQNVTKHAEKLNKCAESKIQRGKTGMLGSSNCEQGSSWAVEVGGHHKVCSIVVENINKQGLMLIEMLCEECSQFLEIAESIRSLGLTILKGVTEAHGQNTWLWFVVEGQDNKAMHRMDILWSLVQILQPSKQ